MGVEEPERPEILGSSENPDAAWAAVRGKAIDHLPNGEIVIGHGPRLWRVSIVPTYLRICDLLIGRG